MFIFTVTISIVKLKFKKNTCTVHTYVLMPFRGDIIITHIPPFNKVTTKMYTTFFINT